MLSEHEKLLASLRRLVEIDEAEFSYLVSISRLKKYKKGQYIVHQNTICHRTHYVVSGSAIAYHIDDIGKEHIIQFAMEGWWISDIKSFVTGENTVLNVQAVEDCTILEFASDDIKEVYKKAPHVQAYFLSITQRAFLSFQERVLQKLSANAETRIKTFFEKYPGIEQRFSQKIIASYLGMTPEFYSKTRKKIS